MRVLFVTSAPAMPQMLGGSQRTSDALIRALTKRGHVVALAAGLTGNGWLGWRGRLQMKLLRRKSARDRLLGYPTWRSWYSWQAMADVVSEFKPDVAVVLAHSPVANAKALGDLGVPVLMAFQDVEVQQHGGDFAELATRNGIANSRFTAERYASNFGANPIVVHPLIEAANYRTATSQKYATFINPDPKKGLHIVLALAGLRPDIPFLIVEGWPLDPEQLRSLNTAISSLPNVTFRRSLSDMREVYSVTRVLLAPSQWEEGYGRVASEAQISGIPVLGSDRGGLPEAIGPGGKVVRYDAALDEWAVALDALWYDQASYSGASRLALEHSARRALDTRHQLDMWERALNVTANGDSWAAFSDQQSVTSAAA